MVAALTLAGCGGSSPTAKPKVTTTTSTTQKPADPATVDLAKKGVLMAADLGPNWVLDKGAEAGTIDRKGCGTQAASPILELGAGAFQIGPLVHYKDTKDYLSTAATTFADEAAAQRWIDIRKSPAFIECRRLELEAAEKKNDKRYSVETRQTTTDGVGTQGFEVYTTYQFRYDDTGGVRDANGTFFRFVYRVKRTVIAVSIDRVFLDSDPKDVSQAISDDSYRALSAAYARLGA
jgi:hypothetical protein